MKTKYRIQTNNKYRLTRVRKSYLKPNHVKNKSKIKNNRKKKISNSTKPKKLRWLHLQTIQRLFLISTWSHFFLDSNFIGIFSPKNLFPIIKSNNYCFLIQNENDYLYVNVSPTQVYLIQRKGFLSQNFDDKFLAFLEHLSSSRILYANPPSLDKTTDSLSFCVLFHHCLNSKNCFHQTCHQLNAL